MAALFDQVRQEQGRLDILVNNAFSLPEDLTEAAALLGKAAVQLEMFEVGVRSNFVAAWHAAKVMVPQKSGLIVAISGYVGVTYTYGVVFGTCKSAVDRMARDMAIELQPHNVASLSLWQGLTFTERAHRNLDRNPGYEGADRHEPGDRLLARASRARHRGTRQGSGSHAAFRRHLHHRRVGAGLWGHRHRRQGHPLAARTSAAHRFGARSRSSGHGR